MAKDPFRPAENTTQCPKCLEAFGWNKENGLTGQTCPCGYEFTGHERRKVTLPNLRETHLGSRVAGVDGDVLQRKVLEE